MKGYAQHPLDRNNLGPESVRGSLKACDSPYITGPTEPLANPSPKPESILAEAERIVNGERAVDYGDSTANMERIGKITELSLSQAEWAKLDARSIPATVVAKILMAVKLGREAHTHKRDNLVDLCGYAEILNRAQEAHNE